MKATLGYSEHVRLVPVISGPISSDTPEFEAKHFRNDPNAWWDCGKVMEARADGHLKQIGVLRRSGSGSFEVILSPRHLPTRMKLSVLDRSCLTKTTLVLTPLPQSLLDDETTMVASFRTTINTDDSLGNATAIQEENMGLPA